MRYSLKLSNSFFVLFVHNKIFVRCKLFFKTCLNFISLGNAIRTFLIFFDISPILVLVRFFIISGRRNTSKPNAHCFCSSYIQPSTMSKVCLVGRSDVGDQGFTQGHRPLIVSRYSVFSARILYTYRPYCGRLYRRMVNPAHAQSGKFVSSTGDQTPSDMCVPNRTRLLAVKCATCFISK